MKKIAHVDDDPLVRELLERVLSGEGYRVESFGSVSGFLKSLGDGKPFPDLLILDVMVEEDDAGLTAYDTVRREYPGLKMILLTSLGESVRPYFEPTDSETRIMQKPFLPADLTSAVLSLVGDR